VHPKLNTKPWTTALNFKNDFLKKFLKVNAVVYALIFENACQSIMLPLAELIRYVFIAPETLNYNANILKSQFTASFLCKYTQGTDNWKCVPKKQKVARDPEFQKIGVVDQNGMPIVLRAVFYQEQILECSYSSTFAQKDTLN